MSRLFYVSHPQVKIDPDIPVPNWSLSDLGRTRAEAAARSSTLASVRSIYTSTERKAIETAEIFAAALNLTVSIRDGLHENDRSSTGFVPPHEFEKLADAFFANPHDSIRGWERAIDAQIRIVAAIANIIAQAPDGDTIVTGHGGVGTLLYCHASGNHISRQRDQPPGGGNYITINIRTKEAEHAWKQMEMF
jgi:broad specificity phosphatase PhoE